ncbi:hypothetical protein [Staphylococcus coagulans]|uniref:hypothetical protein n=1 Tax=Staphylococcus coagulans TaxID=74706 RepID=UPI001FD9D8A5|nr:hypothetical protein [Staphylococcus coagulans]
MKIKTKKKMNLLQLLEWAWENHANSKGKIFFGNKWTRVEFDLNKWLYAENAVKPGETFTVEIEEEITEETVISKLVETYLDSKGRPSCYSYSNKSINYFREQ